MNTNLDNFEEFLKTTILRLDYLYDMKTAIREDLIREIEFVTKKSLGSITEDNLWILARSIEDESVANLFEVYKSTNDEINSVSKSIKNLQTLIDNW